MSGVGSGEPAVLGGHLAPVGLSIGFLEAPCELVLERLRDWRRVLGIRLKVSGIRTAWPECPRSLEPLEAPWTSELLAAHGATWTVYLNNQTGGGDPWPPTSHLATILDVRWVIATHQPMGSAGHASTQLWLGGPRGEPPLNYIRTIAAHAEDHRWSWETSGQMQTFERPEAYRARKIRDRFDRPLLVEYLHALGIEADDHRRYGEAVILKHRASWWRR